MAKKILFNDEAREALKRGIDSAVNAAKVTIGPRGRNVALDKGYGGPTITNDGVSIVKEITLADPFENMGVEIVKEVASKTNETAGDGTTTASLLLQAIVSEGMRHMQSGVEVMGIKRGIEDATEAVVDILKAEASAIKSTEEITQVASVSAESVELGTIIAQTIKKVGQDGVVTVEESQGFDMTSEVVEGMQFDKGYISPYMVTDAERMEAVHQAASVLICDKKITSIKDLLPILEKMGVRGQKDLVLIAEDIEGDVLPTLVLNKLRGSLNVLAIKAPGFGDRKKALLEDTACVTGATVVSEEKGMKLDDIGLEVLGAAKKIIASKDTTTIIDGKGKKADIEARVAQLKMELQNSSSSFDREKIEERIAKLSGGVAVIRVGAATETEMKYLKLKIEDAVNATKAALEEGVVAGGGSALVLAAQQVRTLRSTKKFKTREEEIGYDIILNACEWPLRQIGVNSGKGDGSMIVEKVRELGGRGGYDSVADAYLPDMIAAGIIDPVKVTRHALANAASAAGTFLTTQVAIASQPAEDSKASGAGMGHPGMGGPMGMDF